MSSIGAKIRYIPIGIETPAFMTKEMALEELWKMIPREKLPQESMRIAIIAELTANKGIVFALEAMIDLRTAASENFICVIMGEGEEINHLQEYVKSHHLEEKVFILGFVQDASSYLLAFDVFLLPSIKEGMPYVLLEAGEAGIPIITTDIVNPEIKERYENVRLIRPGNGFAIADAVRKVRESMHATPASTTPHFPLATMVQQTIETYTK
jgi:glycosyltransferase involved in cell wall biosynthesis